MQYYLSLGANLGERESTIENALRLIEQQIGSLLRCSSFYYSEPWGFESQNNFCNICCAVESQLSPMEFLLTTQAIERALGRTHKTIDANYSDRVIDIDIIQAFDDDGNEVVCSTPALTLPHPLWQQRDFVRIPLSEIAPITLG